MVDLLDMSDDEIENIGPEYIAAYPVYIRNRWRELDEMAVENALLENSIFWALDDFEIQFNAICK